MGISGWIDQARVDTRLDDVRAKIRETEETVGFTHMLFIYIQTRLPARLIIKVFFNKKRYLKSYIA